MKTRILLGAALLLSVAGVSVAATTSDIAILKGHGHGEDGELRRSADDGAPVRMAREERHHERVAERRGHDDDEDDDEDEGGRALPQNGPADPNAPVPDNGLFKDRARPKVEVQ